MLGEKNKISETRQTVIKGRMKFHCLSSDFSHGLSLEDGRGINSFRSCYVTIMKDNGRRKGEVGHVVWHMSRAQNMTPPAPIASEIIIFRVLWTPEYPTEQLLNRQQVVNLEMQRCCWTARGNRWVTPIKVCSTLHLEQSENRTAEFQQIVYLASQWAYPTGKKAFGRKKLRLISRTLLFQTV